MEILGSVPQFRPAGRLRGPAYSLLWNCGTGLLHLANGFAYVAAGLLRREDLRVASQLQWRNFCASVDEVDAGLTPFEQRVYSRWLRPSDRVLLVGSGAGRDLLGLRRLGYDVTGVEQAPELAELSRQNLERHAVVARVEAGSIEAVPLPRFDAVIWSNFCYGCVHPSATRVATLERIRVQLSPGGRILLGYVTFVSQNSLSVLLMRVSATLASADWRPEAGDRFSRDHLAPGVLRFAHTFRPADVERECVAAGLRVVAEESTGDDRTRCAILQIEGADRS